MQQRTHCHWLSWPSHSRIWFQADRPIAFARTSVPEPIIACPWIFRAWNRKCLVIANADAFASFFCSRVVPFSSSILFVLAFPILWPRTIRCFCLSFNSPESDAVWKLPGAWTNFGSREIQLTGWSFRCPCYGGVNVQCSWWINLQEVLGLLWPALIHLFLWAHYALSELVTSYRKAPVPQSFVHFLLMPAVGLKNLLPFEGW